VVLREPLERQRRRTTTAAVDARDLASGGIKVESERITADTSRCRLGQPHDGGHRHSGIGCIAALLQDTQTCLCRKRLCTGFLA